MDVTRNGKTCLRWREANIYQAETENYCRTPQNDRNNAGGPWCFVKDGWDSCNVPVCGSKLL